MTDYTILVAAPRIPLRRFSQVLLEADSPLAAYSGSAYQVLTRQQVDPALALAQWQKESGYGRLGVGAANRNPGNLRIAPGFPTGPDGFTRFPTWLDGVRAYTNLLASDLYGRSKAYNTALTMPHRYAPAADSNDPDAYGHFLVRRINELVGIHDDPPAAEEEPMTNLFPITTHRSIELPRGTVLYRDSACRERYTSLADHATLGLISASALAFLVADGDYAVWAPRVAGARIVTVDQNAGK